MTSPVVPATCIRLDVPKEAALLFADTIGIALAADVVGPLLRVVRLLKDTVLIGVDKTDSPVIISELPMKRSWLTSADTASPPIVTAEDPGAMVVLFRTTLVGLTMNT